MSARTEGCSASRGTGEQRVAAEHAAAVAQAVIILHIDKVPRRSFRATCGHKRAHASNVARRRQPHDIVDQQHQRAATAEAVPSNQDEQRLSIVAARRISHRLARGAARAVEARVVVADAGRAHRHTASAGGAKPYAGSEGAGWSNCWRWLA